MIKCTLHFCEYAEMFVLNSICVCAHLSIASELQLRNRMSIKDETAKIGHRISDWFSNLGIYYINS